jgi:hypothetical protein
VVAIFLVLVYLHFYQKRVKKHMAQADHLYKMVQEMHAKMV